MNKNSPRRAKQFERASHLALLRRHYYYYHYYDGEMEKAKYFRPEGCDSKYMLIRAIADVAGN